MKSTIEQNLEFSSKREYPYLGKLKNKDDLVYVLFIKPCTGVVVYTNDTSVPSLGAYSGLWNEDDFEFCFDKVILRN